MVAAGAVAGFAPYPGNRPRRLRLAALAHQRGRVTPEAFLPRLPVQPLPEQGADGITGSLAGGEVPPASLAVVSQPQFHHRAVEAADESLCAVAGAEGVDRFGPVGELALGRFDPALSVPKCGPVGPPTAR